MPPEFFCVGGLIIVSVSVLVSLLIFCFLLSQFWLFVFLGIRPFHLLCNLLVHDCLYSLSLLRIKDLHDRDNHDGVITHLETDILECKVKWASGSITMNKASGGDGIPAELYDAVKALHSICQQIWKTQQWPQDWKRSVFIPVPKNHSNYCTVALISHASKVMLKSLQARLQQYVNYELPDVQAAFRKSRGSRDQIANDPLDHRKSK